MTERRTSDPLVSDELIEIALEAHHIRFKFANSVLQIGAPFSVFVEGKSITDIDPNLKSGDLASLWTLIGRVVRSVVWNDTIRIVFDGGLEIGIGPRLGRLRGSIIGRHDMTVEDF
jgi:hypothetical protein